MSDPDPAQPRGGQMPVAYADATEHPCPVCKDNIGRT
jgi:hypothetical protein